MRNDIRNLNQRWLCAQVRAGCEFRSEFSLRERGYETFVPGISQKRQQSDRIKIVQAPLFTGYVFLRFNAASIHPVITSPGVLRLVGTGVTPTPIEDSEIEALQLSAKAGLVCGPCAYLSVGEEVEVLIGSLASLRGKIVRFRNKDRLVLSVNLIQRSVFIEVDGHEVVPISRASSMDKMTEKCVSEQYSGSAS